MTAHRSHLAFPALLAAVLVVLVAAPAEAQKVSRTYFEDAHHGFRFRQLEDWSAVPVQERQRELGFIGQMAGPKLATKVGGNAVYTVIVDMSIAKFEDRKVETGDEAGLKRRVKSDSSRGDVSQALELLSSLRDYDPERPDVDEELEIDGVPTRHRLWKAFNGDFEVLYDTWTFRLRDYDIALIYWIPAQHEKKFLKVFEKSAETFERMERVDSMQLGAEASYEQALAYHQQEAARTPGWRALPTPSKKYIIKTSSDDDDFVEEVIERLELSRELYEEDFPPKVDIDRVSVVRVCKDREEMQRYGQTGGSTAGFFSPLSAELVLYDGVNVDRNMTFAVMSHEAFHQYCHFMFDQSEAHRWFDEGHGDYYGGVEFKRGKAKVTARMPAGLDRLTYVREMVREGKYAPLWEHVNYSHPQWNSNGIASYCQSWSIVYMLRQGMLGKVPSKVWRDEYEKIIPAYVETLHAGFQAAYEEIREERRKASKEGEEPDLEVNRFDLDEKAKEKIWEKAMEAAWGDVDMEQFEADWLLYVEKYLKD